MAVQGQTPSEETIRHQGHTVGELRNRNGSRVFVWFQNPLRFYGDAGGFSMGEGLLSKVPVTVTTFVVKTDEGDGYVFDRHDFETGEKIPITDSRFNETPPEPQYAVPKGDAQTVLNL